jgi:mgtE-like transporter
LIRDFKEILPILLICSVSEVIAGISMSTSSHKLSMLPALIILIPPSLALRGFIYGSLGSRFGTYLHTGKIKPKFELNPVVIQSLNASIILLILLSLINGVVSAKIATLLGIQRLDIFALVDLTVVSVLSVIISALVMIPATMGIAIGSYRFGLDPDNVTSPFITVLGDMIALPVIFICVDIVLWCFFGVKIVFLAFVIALMLVTYRFCKGLCRRISAESLPILMLCLALDFMAGVSLGSELEKFVKTPGLLTIIPAMLAIGGAMGGVLVARLSTLLHLGYIRPKPIPSRMFSKLVGLMFLLDVIVFSFLGVIGFAFNDVFAVSTPPLVVMIAVTVLTGLLLMVIMSFASYYLSVVSFRLGLDPDNVGIPVITSLIDMSGAYCFIAVLRLLGF